jgi:hypothetical protein
MKVSAQYVEAMRAYHDSNPDHEADMHARELGATGLAEGTQRHIVEKRLAGVVPYLHANSGERMRISALETSEKQIPEIQKLHKSIVSGNSAPSDAEETDDYLRERGAFRGRR